MVGVNEASRVRDEDVFEVLDKMGHEQVVICNDSTVGLKAIIGIHNTVLGPALGGTRMWNYSSDKEALIDVLRLSRGMTFKAAISGLNLGGGKAVIIGNAATMKNEAMLRRFGKFIESLNGKYVTAEDVNMTPRDMEYISMETRHVSGLSEVLGGGGDPSPVTAYGVYVGIKACAKKVFGSDNLNNKKIVVQGVGSVGMQLCELLYKEGAKLFVSDIDEERKMKAAQLYKSEVVDNANIFELEADIYSPCALGASLNDDTIGKLKCSIVAGAANNQLADEKRDGRALHERGILYAPDFVINAGGVIMVACEIENLSFEEAKRRTEAIYDTTLRVFDYAKTNNYLPWEAAQKLSIERIQESRRARSTRSSTKRASGGEFSG